MTKKQAIPLVLAATLLVVGLAFAASWGHKGFQAAEGPELVAQIEVGPFDIHRKYRSMEGPYVSQTFEIADLLASKKVSVGEPLVKFVETGATPSMTMASADPSKPVINLVHSNEKKTLYWLKGMSLKVLDENDKPLPTAEFICHFNLDVEPRGQIFKDIDCSSSTRLMTLTQGQTDFRFPDGFAVPVAGTEQWHFTFQAANRTTDAHRRIKHLLTLEFIKDSDLRKPIKALSWYAPYIAVKLGEDAQKAEDMHGPSCMVTSSGSNAPNMVAGSTLTIGKDKLSGHWAVPPGLHDYVSPVNDERDAGFASKDRIIHAVWSHIHPLCTQVSLNMCDGNKKKTIFKVAAQTKTDKGLELAHIDNISSEKGILMPAAKHYELDATYDNVTKQTHDSMVTEGIFYEDDRFVKPVWKDEPVVAEVPPATNQAYTAADYNGTDQFARFDMRSDGPLLTQPKGIELITSAGKIHIVLDPSIAPQHATQLYRLFKEGAFDDTKIYRYQPGYLLQVGAVDLKHEPGTTVYNKARVYLRRLPLETAQQDHGKGLHKKWALTMAREKPDDSAVSSFSILLADAPHLNHQYTVFGNVVDDPVSMATIKQITVDWPKSQAYIVDAQDSAMSPEMQSALSSLQGNNAESCKDSLYCGIKPPKAPAVVAHEPAPEDKYPLFNPKKDGPLLSSAKSLEITTSAGKIHIVVEPDLAPQNASQMYRLFKAGAFAGTTISRYEPNFVLQAALAETKSDPANAISEKVTAMFRRLPLEVNAQKSGKGLHKKWALCMAHSDADPNSAVSSFSIILGDAPHLDHKYTVFGHVVADPETTQTLDKIAADWSKTHPYIENVKDIHASIANLGAPDSPGITHAKRAQ